MLSTTDPMTCLAPAGNAPRYDSGRATKFSALLTKNMTDGTTIRGTLNVIWWNANNFLHFLAGKAKSPRSRWPKSQEQYAEKCARVDTALNELFSVTGKPHVLILAEVTQQAANELQARILPGYRVSSLDVKKDSPTPQIAMFYAPDTKDFRFREQVPIVVPRMPDETRPMGVLDVEFDGHTVRIISCHWQSRIGGEVAKKARGKMADHLAVENYQFVDNNRQKHHLMIVGDFNDDPFDNSLEDLHTHRHRERSKSKPHRFDKQVNRLHLYNTSWRLLGENFAHPITPPANPLLKECAGTFYWRDYKTWHHFDQIIVSGGLVGNTFPHIDESKIGIGSTAAFLDSDGLPLSFIYENGKVAGLSDHLPIFASIRI
ncbi:endonuclease/exonuclease/phosphatase family protein [Burkholderia pyrrocinia]|uniref:Endonuclease/exonuclease/phosphatase family protein n=1 Tax=Burkholderia pyrrocinia TaxID=60550 RepID=A0ABZ3BCJ3_BURPY